MYHAGQDSLITVMKTATSRCAKMLTLKNSFLPDNHPKGWLSRFMDEEIKAQGSRPMPSEDRMSPVRAGDAGALGAWPV